MDEYYDMKLTGQILNVSVALRDMLEYSKDVKLLTGYGNFAYYDFNKEPVPRNISFQDMKHLEFNKDCFVQSLNEFFTTLKKSNRLNKYNLKFTIEDKNKNKNKNKNE
jgi:hypothetical protein